MSRDDYPSINTDAWTQYGPERKSGVLNLVRDSNDVGQIMACWFKYPQSNDSGPIPANEFIACKLGELLDLPVAKIQFKDLAGKKGSISLSVAPEPLKWANFPYKSKLQVYLDNYDVLSQIIAFDVWTNNQDRNADNLLYSQAEQRKKKYKLHLIDHGHAIYGPSSQPTPKEAFSFNTHVLLPELSGLFSHGIDFFRGAIEEIQHIKDEQIHAIIDLVPEGYMTQEQKDYVKNMLSYRRDKLYNEIEEECKKQGGA